MQIFCIEGNKNNIDFIKSAQSLDNYRVVKQILESCQLLSSALILNGLEAPYKLSFQHHPCTKWTAESAQNFYDLMEHTNALIKEYYSRFNKTNHQCHMVLKQC